MPKQPMLSHNFPAASSTLTYEVKALPPIAVEARRPLISVNACRPIVVETDKNIVRESLPKEIINHRCNIMKERFNNRFVIRITNLPARTSEAFLSDYLEKTLGISPQRLTLEKNCRAQGDRTATILMSNNESFNYAFSQLKNARIGDRFFNYYQV